MLLTLLKGFGLGAGLIIAIGAQNAFVLRQGLRKEHVFWVALICALCDVVLITFGAIGFGTLVASSPLLTTLAAWGGAVFLLVYGFLAFRAALSPNALEPTRNEESVSRRSVVLTTLAVSLLNPHVYLDTVVLLGSVAGQYPVEGRIYFAGGAVLASLAWFFCLAFGAALLTPLFRKPAAWRVLDIFVGLVMWLIALSLVRTALPHTL